MIYELESLWPDFGMMISQHGTRILRFSENRRIPHLKVFFTIYFYFSVIIRTRDTKLDPFSRKFCVDDVTTLSQDFKILRERFHKGIINLKVPFTFDSYLPINIGTWNTNLDLFQPFLGWWRNRRKSKLSKKSKKSKFWDSEFKK